MLRIIEKGEPLSFTVGEDMELILVMSPPHLPRWHRLKIWFRKVWDGVRFW